MRALRFVALAGLASCNASDTRTTTVTSAAEAGLPPTPVYQRMQQDQVTGDNTPVVVSGTGANCVAGMECYIADPGADSYNEDLYERPAGQGSLARLYAPSLDIITAQVGVTTPFATGWLFYRINLFGPETGQAIGTAGSLPHHYGLEINLDDDPMGDLIIDVRNPSGNLGANWGTVGIEAKTDENETMGGPRPLEPDGPGQAGGGYEHKAFDQGMNLAPGKPGGATAIQARIQGAAVEIAVFRPYLESLTNDTVDALGIRPYADAGQVSTSELYTHDDENRVSIGSPYPWLVLTGAPASCPAGASGNDGLSAGEVAALESGTNVNTGILNPCYAAGGIYLRDNAGTIHDLANQNTIQIDVDLSLVKTDAVDPVAPGDTITYTLTVTNATNGIVTGVRITDPLPSNVTFVGASPGCTPPTGMFNTVTCNIGALAPMGTAAVTITVATTAIGTVTNTASVTSDGDELTPANNTDTEPTTVMLLCGNGQLNAGEICDDGDNINGNGCNNDCRRSNGQPCTMDNQCSSGICDEMQNQCEGANVCGNTVIEPANNEVCDDGGVVPNDGCEADCKLSLGQPCTGDNQCSSGECDETGSMTCEAAGSCGNGTLQGNEICDDGNTTNGDGCESDCRLTDGRPCTMDNQCHSGECDETEGVCEPANSCGNGTVNAGEACDDGNTVGGDTCEADCKLPDGAMCQNDNQCHSGVCDQSSGECEPANTCGNGRIEGSEGCDDGDTDDGDGCNSLCRIEDGQPCDDDDQCQSGVCDPQTGTCGGDDHDGDGIFDTTDIDDDNDGILDRYENLDTDTDDVIDQLDLDSDNDGIADATEAGHGFKDNDGNFIMDCTSAYGANGFCNALETSPDSGMPTNVALLDSDSDNLPDARDLDSDNDSIPDLIEGDSRCADTNKDGLCDGSDDDDDGIMSALESNFTVGTFGTLNARSPADTDGDGAPNFRDLDSDGDSFDDIKESGIARLDGNDDGRIDMVNDEDTDGLKDQADDSDLDGRSDHDDSDASRFGGYLVVPTNTDGDDDGSDFVDTDSDNDDEYDGSDNCRLIANPGQEDADDDFIGDVCDASDDREWSVSGGCGCATNDSSPGGTLVVMLGVLFAIGGGRRRRRRGAAVGVAATAAALAVVAMPTVSHAQNNEVEGDFGTERFQLATDREGILDVESGSVRKHLELDMGLWLGYENDPLVLNRTDGGRDEVGSIVANQVSGELLAAIGLWNHAQLGLIVPLVFLQSDDLPTGGPGLMMPEAASGGFALGDLRLVPKLNVMSQGDFGADVALLATLTVPTSSGDGYAGDTNVTFAPALAVSRTFDTGLRIGANLGYRFRERSVPMAGTTQLDLEVDDEVFSAIGVGYDLSKSSGSPVELDAGFAFATAADDMFGAFNRNYAEIKGGINIDVPGPLLAFAATGFGVAEGWGTPDWRALAGVRVDRGKPEAPPPPPPTPDTDGDGLLDNVDRCPTEPEDKDTFEDDDGCPDLDDDKDGVTDVNDKCRLEPEDVDQFEDTDGCPENDNDNDKILDAQDKCPMDPEDVDSFQDDDGCPDTDNDNDTVLDASDDCRDVAGPVDNKGCPWPDKDGDGVIDKFDNCPTWKGKPENNGCALPQLVKITESKLELYDTVYFATGRSTIQRRSHKLLDQVAAVLKAHTELVIKIEGHTDSVGGNARNLKLSQARADAVMKYLVKKGVDQTKLSAQGFGEENPIEDNKTAKGRGKNRRVEFMASRVVETVQPVAPQPGTAPAPAAPAQPAQPKATPTSSQPKNGLERPD